MSNPFAPLIPSGRGASAAPPSPVEPSPAPADPIPKALRTAAAKNPFAALVVKTAERQASGKGDWLDDFSTATKDLGGAIARGVSKAGQSVYDLAAGGLNLVDDGIEAVTGGRVAEAIDGKGARFGGLNLTLPGEAQGTVAALVEPMAQFGAGLAVGGPATQALGVTAKAGPLAGAAVSGALADFLAFSGSDPRLSDLIQSVPELRNPVTAFLASNPEDSEAVGRLKNVLEGAGLGAIADGLVGAARAWRRSGRAAANPSAFDTLAGGIEEAATVARDAPSGAAPVPGGAMPPNGKPLPSPPARPGMVTAPAAPEVTTGEAARVLDKATAPPIPRNTVGAVGAPRTEADLAAETVARDLGAVGGDARTDLLLDMMRGRAKTPKPQSLTEFVRASGGLKNEGGELTALGFNPQTLPGFINNARGKTLDDMALAAWEAGYLGARETRPTIREFLDAVDADYRGLEKRYRPEDQADVDLLADLARLQDQVEREGINVLQTDNATIRALLAGESEGTARTAADLAREEADLAAAGVVAPDPRGLTGPAERAGNINLGFLRTGDDVKQALKATAEVYAGRLDDARRGVVTQEETAKLARQLGMTEQELLSRRKGQAFNAEEALAARNLLTRSAEELTALARKAKGGTDADVLAFEQALARHMAIQEQVAGLTAEAGRALAAFKIEAKSQGVRDKLIRQAIEEGGGREKVEEIAERLAAINDPDAIAPFVREAWKPKFRDKLFELWINSLLSGPRTHVVNVTSNFLTSLWTLPENALAAALGAVRGGGDKITGREVVARLYGLAEGSIDGLRYAAKALRQGESTFDTMTKIDRQRPGNAIGGAVGQVVRVPTRLLAAEDDFFKAMAYRAELRSLALRSGLAKNLKGDALKEHVRSILANPGDTLHLRAMDRARYVTFTRELGRLGRTVTSAINQIPGGRVIVPFIRTPANLIKYAAERTPLGFAMREVREALAKGGAERDLALSRIFLGSGTMVAIASLADAGLVTGAGPRDPGERRLWLQDHQPYSVKLGDRWVSYQRLDPLATLLGVAADAVDLSGKLSEPDSDKLGALLVGSVANNLLDKTWLRGPSELVQAITDPERYGQSWMQSLAGTLVPTGVAQLTQMQDPVLRDRGADKSEPDPLLAEARALLNAVLSRLPGQSEDLPPIRDIWGNVIERESLGPSIVSPFPTKSAGPDALSQELRRLGYFPGKPSREVMGAPLSPQEYDRLSELTGKMARQSVERLVSLPQWSQIPDDGKRKAIERAFNEAREAARKLLLAESPELVKRIAEERRKGN